MKCYVDIRITLSYQGKSKLVRIDGCVISTNVIIMHLFLPHILLPAANIKCTVLAVCFFFSAASNPAPHAAGKRHNDTYISPQQSLMCIGARQGIPGLLLDSHS